MEDIKTFINNESNIFIKIILSSSINNSDIRNFIIEIYIKKCTYFINEYEYIPIIFQLNHISGLIDKLTDTKRKIF